MPKHHWALWALGLVLVTLSSPGIAQISEKDLEESSAGPLMLYPKAELAVPKEKQRPVGLANLIFRPIDEERVGVVGPDLKLKLLEHLRARKLNILGAESLVFEKDRSHDAELLLGGTVNDLKCDEDLGQLNCRIQMTWELMSVAQDAIVYRVQTTVLLRNVESWSVERLALRSLTDSVDRVLRRPRFVDLLRVAPPTVASADNHIEPLVEFTACRSELKPLPESAEELLDRTVLIDRGDSGFGSGFFFSEDPLVLTAAHVVEGKDTVIVVRRDGTRVKTTVLRRDEVFDVALLRVNTPNEAGCIPVRDAPLRIGSEVFVLGSPAHRELAFSLSRGIVSGSRSMDGVPLLQTDATINPGNSGGPMVGTDGDVAALVSWKVAGGAIEGLGFGVSIPSALARLGLKKSDSSSPALLTAVTNAKQEVTLIEDRDDPSLSLYPRTHLAQAEERAQVEASRQRRIVARKPLQIFRGVSLGLAVAGFATVIVTNQLGRDDISREQWNRRVAFNTAGWISAGVGSTAFLGSLWFTAQPKEAPGPHVGVLVGPTSLSLVGDF